jgi:hypothetical protein
LGLGPHVLVLRVACDIARQGEDRNRNRNQDADDETEDVYEVRILFAHDVIRARIMKACAL